MTSEPLQLAVIPPEAWEFGKTALLLVIAVLGVVNKRAIKEVHLSMNSRLDELVRSKSAEARTEGHAAGMAAQKVSDHKTK